ncbi:uncharacterized protein BYT42DRAFT_612958 [Radiomyces spectabilis]|uniref:uncharacterized protein n=1 Tax=Radiomyces spectabilis TaxID=64574 RepID=UPI00221FFDB6|nr:uncharacterized protein BYT42DRAFT_612958 [Radiomyces spectabilis]KAI8381149.1 hypothetical protein BYT42DRAFT_612958 [Radiomyces spectabilis]
MYFLQAWKEVWEHKSKQLGKDAVWKQFYYVLVWKPRALPELKAFLRSPILIEVISVGTDIVQDFITEINETKAIQGCVAPHKGKHKVPAPPELSLSDVIDHRYPASEGAQDNGFVEQTHYPSAVQKLIERADPLLKSLLMDEYTVVAIENLVRCMNHLKQEKKQGAAYPSVMVKATMNAFISLQGYEESRKYIDELVSTLIRLGLPPVNAIFQEWCNAKKEADALVDENDVGPFQTTVPQSTRSAVTRHKLLLTLADYLEKQTDLDALNTAIRDIRILMEPFFGGFPASLFRQTKKIARSIFWDDQRSCLNLSDTCWKDLGAIFPILSEKLGPLSIPSIHGQLGNFNFSLSNIILDWHQVLPTMVKVHRETLITTDAKYTWLDRSHEENWTHYEFQGSAIVCQNMDYVFNRTSFPMWADHGKCKVLCNNIYIKVVASTENTATRLSGIEIRECCCTMENVSLRVEETEHRILTNLLAPRFANTLQKSLQQHIADIIKNVFEQI